MNDEAQSTVGPVPSSWPGAFGLYKHSKQIVSLNLWTLVYIALLALVVNIAATALFKQSLGNLVSFLIGGLETAATTLVFLAGVKGRKIEVMDAVKEAVPFWLRMLLLNLIIVFALIGSFLLFVIPFFFVLPRLLLANYFLVDKKMDPVDAFKASWHATKGNSGKAWGIIGVNFAMCLLLLTIIGIPFAIYFLIMYSAAFVVLYSYLIKHPAESTAAPQPAAS